MTSLDDAIRPFGGNPGRVRVNVGLYKGTVRAKREREREREREKRKREKGEGYDGAKDSGGNRRNYQSNGLRQMPPVSLFYLSLSIFAAHRCC